MNIWLGTSMKFVIEISTVSPDGSEAVVQRASVEAINPGAARKQATTLLHSWKRRRRARVFNESGQEIYSLS
jgi:hypothetical protein